MESVISEKTPNLEVQQKPKVLVTFYGWDHSDFNITGMDSVKRALATHLDQTKGDRTILLESASMTGSLAQKAKDLRKTHGGLVNTSLARQLKREKGFDPSPTAIENRKGQIDAVGVVRAIDERLLPADSVTSYLRNHMIDDLAQQYDFNLMYETHDKKTAGSTRAINQEFVQVNQRAYSAWQQGNFTEALASYRTAEDLGRRLAERDIDVVEDLKGKIRKLLKTQDGGSVFILFGAAHEPMIPALKRKLGPNVPVEFETFNGRTTQLEALSILKLRSGNAITDEDVARQAFAYHANNDIAQAMKNRGNLSVFMNNYEDIVSAIDSIASSLSLKEIEQACKNKQVIELVRSHPSAETIRDFIEI